MTPCGHSPSAVCFLCSDQEPWWREVRKALEMGEEPPNSRVVPLPVRADSRGIMKWKMADYIRDHPGCTTREIMAGLYMEQEYVSVLSVQLARDGIIRREVNLIARGQPLCYYPVRQRSVGA